jgi:hypothetical protein
MDGWLPLRFYTRCDVQAQGACLHPNLDLLLATAVLLACYVPAPRAVKRDPVIALRFE